MEQSGDLRERARGGTAPRYVPNPSLIVTDLGDELVLLDPASGEMYALVGPGRLAWLALPEGEAAAVEALVGRYHVERERAAADVGTLVRDLLHTGLIVERAGGELAP